MCQILAPQNPTKYRHGAPGCERQSKIIAAARVLRASEEKVGDVAKCCRIQDDVDGMG